MPPNLKSSRTCRRGRAAPSARSPCVVAACALWDNSWDRHHIDREQQGRTWREPKYESCKQDYMCAWLNVYLTMRVMLLKKAAESIMKLANSTSTIKKIYKKLLFIQEVVV